MRKEPTVPREELFAKLGYKPHSSNQWDVHRSNARFRILCCGRRWGKTTFAGNELTAYMFNPNSYYWIVGPSYKTGEKEFRVVLNNLVRKLKLGKEIKYSNNVKQGDMRIEMPWNTILEVVSATNKDSLIGEGLDGAIMSEAAVHTSDIWEMFIEPALSDKRGWAIFPSTPRGYNWFQGLWEIGQLQEDFEDYQSWRLPTWTNTAAYPGGREDLEIKRIERKASRPHFLQEYAAEFTAFEGQIYDEFDRNIHVTSIEYNPAWKHYWVFDFGFADPFVCLDIMVDPSDNVYVWREYQVSNLSTWEHAIKLKGRDNPPGFHVDAMYGDPRGADEIATLALVLGYVQANPVGWSLGIEAVRRWIKLQPDGKPKLFIDEKCFNLIRQIEQLRMKTTKEGVNTKEGQHDYDDHGADALRYFFNEHFILRTGSGSLADVYGVRGNTEAATFFQNHTKITLEQQGVPY